MKASAKRPVVVIFQYRLFHYRTELFERMREMLAASGITLEVVYGQSFGAEKLKNDQGVLSWGKKVKNLYFPIKEKKDLCWQPLPASVRNPDLVIFMQENRLLANYYWMLKGALGRVRTGFWGHGRDFQSRARGGLRERWKRASIRAVDWWFAYTELTLGLLDEAGFPRERVTLLNNSIDTEGFRRDADSVGDAELVRLRAELGIPQDARIGLFCGSIYPDKKPEFLIEAADMIRAGAPDFHLIVIGDGQSAPVIRAAADSRPWLHWVGARRGVEKAAFFKMSAFVLNPGSVGLHVLDAFALGLPMLTTTDALHGPEIAYLRDGLTGFTTRDDTQEYAGRALSLLHDAQLAHTMRQACLAAGADYSVHNMAASFTDGIVRCLNTK